MKHFGRASAVAPWATAAVLLPLLLSCGALHGIELNTDRPGLDYKKIVLDAKYCEDQCAKEPQCKAWTYVKPGTVQGPDAKCWLKSAVPSPLKDTCCESGVKGGAKSTLPTISTQGDLAAWDWCYLVNENIGEIAFYPIVKNVGQAAWASAKEGYYKIGVGVSGTIIESTHPLPASPYWWLEKGDVAKLPDGQKRAFSTESGYSLKNLWVLYHVEDTNPSNNGFPGPGGVFLGKEFLPNGSMTGKSCKE